MGLRASSKLPSSCTSRSDQWRDVSVKALAQLILKLSELLMNIRSTRNSVWLQYFCNTAVYLNLVFGRKAERSCPKGAKHHIIVLPTSILGDIELISKDVNRLKLFTVLVIW